MKLVKYLSFALVCSLLTSCAKPLNDTQKSVYFGAMADTTEVIEAAMEVGTSAGDALDSTESTSRNKSELVIRLKKHIKDKVCTKTGIYPNQTINGLECPIDYKISQTPDQFYYFIKIKNADVIALTGVSEYEVTINKKTDDKLTTFVIFGHAETTDYGRLEFEYVLQLNEGVKPVTITLTGFTKFKDFSAEIDFYGDSSGKMALKINGESMDPTQLPKLYPASAGGKSSGSFAPSDQPSNHFRWINMPGEVGI